MKNKNKRPAKERPLACLFAIWLVPVLLGIRFLTLPEVQAQVQEPVIVTAPEVQAVSAPVETPKVEPDIEALIGVKAKEYGVSAPLMLALAKCESNLDPLATNWQGSSASGLFQFTIGTWQDGIRWRKLDWKLEDRFDPWKSADMAGWYIKRGEVSRWACLKLINN